MSDFLPRRDSSAAEALEFLNPLHRTRNHAHKGTRNLPTSPFVVSQSYASDFSPNFWLHHKLRSWEGSAIGLASPLWVAPYGIGPKTDPSPPHTQHTLGVGCNRSEGC